MSSATTNFEGDYTATIDAVKAESTQSSTFKAPKSDAKKDPPQFNCEHCNRPYVRQSALDRHLSEGQCKHAASLGESKVKMRAEAEAREIEAREIEAREADAREADARESLYLRLRNHLRLERHPNLKSMRG